MAENEPRTIGYLRVSRESQDPEKNWADILTLANREDLGRSELSRLGRSMLECMEILSIASTAGIRVYAIKGAWRLDEIIQSRIIAMAFSMAAEIERDLISARTTEALRARKAAGLPLGRPKGPGKSKLDPFRRRSKPCSQTGQRRSSSPSDTTRHPPTARTGSERTESGNPGHEILWRNRYLCAFRADNLAKMGCTVPRKQLGQTFLQRLPRRGLISPEYLRRPSGQVRRLWPCV